MYSQAVPGNKKNVRLLNGEKQDPYKNEHEQNVSFLDLPFPLKFFCLHFTFFAPVTHRFSGKSSVSKADSRIHVDSHGAQFPPNF
jgi:hypothetical protein